MLALRGDLEDRGGVIAFNTPIERLMPGAHDRRWAMAAFFGGGDAQSIIVDAVVNCAGLGAQRLARATEDYPPQRVPRLVLAKGNYFSFAGRPAFSRLIYPVPVPGGLGVHVTLDLAGRMRFGPDVEWIDAENYDVEPARAAAFYARIREYWPALPDNSLAPDYAGIRPKLTGPGEPAADFIIDGAGAARLGRPRAPVRHRIAGAHLRAVAGAADAGLSVGLSPLALVGAGRRRLRLFDRRRCRPFRGGLDLRLGELAAQVRRESGVSVDGREARAGRARCCRPSGRHWWRRCRRGAMSGRRQPAY